ncbi:glycosyltransferase family 4 protein [Compostimonas suwonensis]|uniref:Glycosyltransferase involved in cell wall biosynthesis n=1 Tax=Compostimonas suwonensis TaxID=1048394 RepID=A0A2M9C5C5_9MICO|nr:glycosyltransferase family 4 protein [Compostimonas suwonensis]PJJ65724.1 glycosyltransferase involved in cell wall biosynthesis [Compostimonas suwonensis]
MASIAIVLLGFPVEPGGGYKVAYQYANHLARSGHVVDIVHMRPDRFRSSGSSVLKKLARPIQYRLGRHLRPRWFPLDARVRVTNYDRQFIDGIPQADVLVATAVETAEIVSRAAGERGTPGFYFIQHYEDWSGDSAHLDMTWRLPLRKIVIAPWLQEKGRELGVETVLIPNAIDAAAFPRGLPIAQRPLQVLALVSDLEWKRSDLVAEAFHTIAEAIPEVRLRTFGVIDKPRSLPAQTVHVRNPGAAQLSELYQASRVYLCASDGEGWHLPPAEAMSSGAAVVSTDIDGVRAYGDGVALFSPIGDSSALAQNALGLLSDESACDAVAAAGFERMSSYSPDDAAEAFERELLSRLA